MQRLVDGPPRSLVRRFFRRLFFAVVPFFAVAGVAAMAWPIISLSLTLHLTVADDQPSPAMSNPSRRVVK
jgi:hypothetical protein